MKKILIALVLIAMSLTSSVSAQESSDAANQAVLTEEEGTAEEKYLFPVIPPEFRLAGGYRFVSDSGAATANEYEYLHNSFVFGGDISYFSFPHRFHLDIDFANKKDYYGDINYAYKDTVLLQGLNRTLYHNLNNLALFDFDPGGSFQVDRRDKGNDYGVTTSMSNLFLRLKTHDFPFHVYAEGELITRYGSQQQRFYAGTTSPSSGMRTSQYRNVDWETKTLNVGVNSHLGPIEVDYSHGEKRFNVRGDEVMFALYPAVTSGSPPSQWPRAEGEWAHNVIPEFKGSSDTLKLHTSYTGGLVASVTLSKIDRENRDSGAKADYFIGAGEITWVARPELTFFLKYRHRESDIDNPSSITIRDRQGMNPVTYSKNDPYHSIKDSISTDTDTVTGIVRYRPMPGIFLKGEFTHDVVSRNDSEEWGIPDKTTRDIATLSADMRLIKGLNIKLRYTHKDIDDPSINTEPDRSDEFRASVSWVPTPKLNALLSYSIAKEKGDDIQIIGTTADHREVLRDRLFGSLTYLILNDLSLTASYSYIHNKTEQDIAVGAITDSMVPNKIFSHFYGVDINYTPKSNLTIGGGANFTLSSGRFYPSDSRLLNPSIADYSAMRMKETVVYASGEYRFRQGFSLGMQYKYTKLDDDINNQYDDVQDGKAHIVFLTLSKKW